MIKLNDVLKLAKRPHSLEVMRSVVFDGASAIVAADLDWMVGVPCPQPELVGKPPVVVPIRTLEIHMNKGRDLVVYPDHLSNSRGLKTELSVGLVRRSGLLLKDYAQVLDLLPPEPDRNPRRFGLELNALDRVLVVAATKDIRYCLNGVFFDWKEQAIVGTDGRRLHAYRSRLPGGVMGLDLPGSILPRAPLEWLLGSVDGAAEVSVFCGPDAAPAEVPSEVKPPSFLFRTSDAFVWVRRPIEGVYPEWLRVIPAPLTRPVWATLDPVQVADTALALKRVCRAAHVKSPAVVLDFEQGCMVADTESADRLPLPLKLAGKRPDFQASSLVNHWAGFDPQYLADVADCVTPAARWMLSETNAPNESLLVWDGDFYGVVMGIRPQRHLGALRAASLAQEPAPEPEGLPEPCPAAVAAVAAQLVAQVQAKAKPRAARKRLAYPPELTAA